MRVATYNLLAQSMVHYFPAQRPEHLAWENREKHLLRDLDLLTSEGPDEPGGSDQQCLLALQEVDLSMAPSLQPVFERANYTLVKSHYSSPKRNRFGVWLAIPQALFRILETGHVHIGSLIEVPADVSDAEPSGRQGEQIEANAFLEARKRNNQLVYAVVQHIGSKHRFIVAGCHSPCAYWWAGVMTLYHAAVKEELQRLSDSLGGLPFLLLGDFNITPGSSAMAFMINNVVAPDIKPSLSWKPEPWALAHLVPLTADNPERVTCFNGDFAGALDHIFVSVTFPLRGFAVFVPPINSSIPDEDHGSDHVFVSARIDLAE
jgi:hypothetical protein